MNELNSTISKDPSTILQEIIPLMDKAGSTEYLNNCKDKLYFNNIELTGARVQKIAS